jgi:hypothetical protein
MPSALIHAHHHEKASMEPEGIYGRWYRTAHRPQGSAP